MSAHQHQNDVHPERLAALKAGIGLYLKENLQNPHRADFLAAARIEPALVALAKLVSTQKRGDLPAVESWVPKFIRLFNAKPALEQYRKSCFAHLLRCHNQTVARTESTE